MHSWYGGNPAAWRCEEVDSGSQFASPVGLGVSGTSNVYYINRTTNRLMHAYWDGAWEKEVIDGLWVASGSYRGCTIRGVAVVSHGSDQQIFYTMSASGYSHQKSGLYSAIKPTYGLGGWSISQIDPTEIWFPDEHVSATLVQGQSHVFYSGMPYDAKYVYGRRVRHVYSVGGTFGVVDLSDNGGYVDADGLFATEHQGQWVLSVLTSAAKDRLDVFYGQGDVVTGIVRQAIPPRTGPPSISSYSAYGFLNVWIAAKQTDQWNQSTVFLWQYWR